MLHLADRELEPAFTARRAGLGGDGHPHQLRPVDRVTSRRTSDAPFVGEIELVRRLWPGIQSFKRTTKAPLPRLVSLAVLTGSDHCFVALALTPPP